MRPILLTTLLAALLPACGGGATQPGAPSAEPQTMVIQYDRDDDGEPDWITLDTSSHPFRVVEAIHGAAGGDPVDLTELLAGTAIEPELSEALADHLARSFDLAERTEIEVMLTPDRRLSVAILD